MQIVDNKAIVLRTRRPHLITERIQKSKVLKETDGMFDVAIHWGLTEVQALADLRVKNIPSTIERDYKWTGKHTPFDHQKKTAAFLTLRKKAFCFNQQGTGKTASVIWPAPVVAGLKIMFSGLIKIVTDFPAPIECEILTFPRQGCSNPEFVEVALRILPSPMKLATNSFVGFS